MASGRYVSLLRVSTSKQGRDGLGVDAQRATVREFLNGGKWNLVGEYVEVESGRRTDRPELAKALAACRIHNATLVIANLSRLSRNVHFISGLMESGVDFVAADMPTVNRLTIHVLAAVAEEEARAVSIRTKLALAQAKARNVKLGRPENLTKNFEIGRARSIQIRQKKAAVRAADLQPIIKDIQFYHLRREKRDATLRDIADELNHRDVPAARGGQWTATQVMRLIAKMDA